MKSKTKNVGLIYELLIKKALENILFNKNDEGKKFLYVIKENFKPNSEIFKELNLFFLIKNSRFDNELLAKEFLDYVLNARKKLNIKKLNEEKNKLENDIKKLFNNNENKIKEFFNFKINDDNYKFYKEVNYLFINENKMLLENINKIFNIKKKILNNLLSKKNKNKSEIKNIFLKENFINKINNNNVELEKIIKEFNKNYNNINENKKRFLNIYFNNILNESNFNKEFKNFFEKYLIEKKSLFNKLNDVDKIKIKECIKLLKNKIKNNNINSKTLEAVLVLDEIFELIK